jgi:hypothetical protein
MHACHRRWKWGVNSRRERGGGRAEAYRHRAPKTSDAARTAWCCKVVPAVTQAPAPCMEFWSWLDASECPIPRVTIAEWIEFQIFFGPFLTMRPSPNPAPPIRASGRPPKKARQKHAAAPPQPPKFSTKSSARLVDVDRPFYPLRVVNSHQ